MFARPKVLSILTTRRCTAQCDHCCVGASPRATSAIPVARIHGLIDEAKRIPSFERVVFTGGECFLLGRDLDALVAHAHEAGFATRAISNGYWAVNDAAARSRMAGLRAAGLDELMLSTGVFHQRFVPVERVIAAAGAAAAAGVPTRIAIEDCDQSAIADDMLREQLAEPIAAGRVQLAREPWVPDAGERGAAALSYDGLTAEGAARAVGRCPQIMSVLSVTPDQQLVACCGFPLEELPLLRVGSVAERALDELVADAPDELLRMWLHVAGPHGIADFVARYVPGYALPPGASVCQACVALQRDRNAMRVVAEHGGEIAQRVAAAFVHLQRSNYA